MTTERFLRVIAAFVAVVCGSLIYFLVANGALQTGVQIGAVVALGGWLGIWSIVLMVQVRSSRRIPDERLSDIAQLVYALRHPDET